ncbi:MULTISPECIES: histidine phosphatase family protein [unclassified Paludibacterium]|uniref:SixA phosphatase family protein n=1 Tax=unclassified Paludibacterium TaxID=2618429 RepID=UPI001C048096|nr:histidine phosphatase family protein [Paludibacterium sp. B53371]BEV73504.1 phosphohistidine phosphatase SixA [Paludibacterium sp. THUN1379]
MDLILWRHADAEEGSDDLSRALTRKGQQQGRSMAAWLGRRLPQDYVVLASEAKRSRQTAAFLSKGFETEAALNPGAAMEDVLAVLDQYHHVDTVVLVGHQPYLGRLAARLMSGDPQYWNIKKGAIWWLGLRHQAGGDPVRLKAMITPGMLDD